jgi:TRAP-type transport system periplasmic protein
MTRTIRNIMGLTGALVLGAGLSLSAAPASAQVVLTYSPWLPAGYPLNDAVLRPWMAEVERITEGRVTFNWLPTAVGTAAAQFDVVQDGLADMSLVLPGYTPGRFELIELGELPLLSSETAVLGPTFYEYYQAHLEPLRPLPGTHVVSLWATIPTHVVSSRGVINSVSDFTGLKLRAPSATAVAIMERLGAVPVQRPVSEIYELATTGVVDGSFFPISTTYDFNVAETLSHMTLIPGGLGQSVMMFLINEDRWQEISAADREAIMAISGAQMAQAAGELFGAAEAEAIARARSERPDQTQTASDELHAQIETAIQPVFESWITRAAARGLADPAAVLQSFRDTLREREAAL